MLEIYLAMGVFSPLGLSEFLALSQKREKILVFEISLNFDFGLSDPNLGEIQDDNFRLEVTRSFSGMSNQIGCWKMKHEGF